MVAVLSLLSELCRQIHDISSIIFPIVRGYIGQQCNHRALNLYIITWVGIIVKIQGKIPTNGLQKQGRYRDGFHKKV